MWCCFGSHVCIYVCINLWKTKSERRRHVKCVCMCVSVCVCVSVRVSIFGSFYLTHLVYMAHKFWCMWWPIQLSNCRLILISIFSHYCMVVLSTLSTEKKIWDFVCKKTKEKKQGFQRKFWRFGCVFQVKFSENISNTSKFERISRASQRKRLSVCLNARCIVYHLGD